MSTSPAFQQINRSCLNNSSSKQLFSFSRQKRFEKVRNGLTSQTDFVLPSFSEGKKSANSFSRSKRELVFGNEKQFGLHPPPNIYNGSSYAQLGNKISMAMKLKEDSLKYLQKVPGPGTYSSRSLDRSTRTINFPKQKRELKFPLENQVGKDTPGPYLIKTQRLKTILSNYRNPGLTKIARKADKTELAVIKLKMKAQQEMKGPKKQGKPHNPELISTFKNSIILKKDKTVVFDKEIRKSYFDPKNHYPSSANYQYFSEFANRNKPDTLETSRRSLSIKARPDLKQRLRTLSVAS